MKLKLKTLADVRNRLKQGVFLGSDVLALTLWGEERGGSVQGRIAVGCVIRNRVDEGGRYGKGYGGVCLKRWQFSCWLPQGGEQNFLALMKLANRSLAREPREISRVFTECSWVAKGIISGALMDCVKKANHYHTKNSTAKWAKGQKAVAEIGEHLFYRL